MSTKPADTIAVKQLSATAEDRNHFYVRAVSPAMRGLEQIIEDIGPTDIPVLLVGESGVGKEMMAMQIHRLSRRRDEPFVKVGCASLTVEFLSTWCKDLEDGRSDNSSSGRGTLFLDEVSELEPPCQAKLLHALPDSHEVPPTHCLAGRVIAASNRDLDEEMRAGRFRQELYYRINGMCLRLPPLRDRKEDIPALVDFFLKKYAALFGRPQPLPSERTLQIFMNHSWPGNIRQLENAVRKIVVLGEDRTVLADWESTLTESRSPSGACEGISLKEAARAASRRAERELMLKVLTRTRWNRKLAAKELQISYKALLYKLKLVGLEDSANS